MPLYEYNRLSSGTIKLALFSPVIFGSILGLWAIQALGPGTPDSVMGWEHSSSMGLRLEQSLVGHFHNLYTILTHCQTFQHIPYIGKTVGQWLYGGVCVPIPPLEVLPGKRR